MSDNASDEEQQQQMEKIYICDDVWYGVFAFLDPFELGLKMALISDRLDVLVDVHFKSRKWLLGRLRILSGTTGNGAEIVIKSSGKQLPIPEGPLPGQLIGFEGIQICYIDQSVIDFLQCISRLFNSSGTNVDIDTGYCERRSWEIIWQKIWPLVNDNICRFSLCSFQLDRLRQFSPAILRNCANLRSIEFSGQFPVFPAEDNAGASSHQAVTKWLLTPRGDGRPKMLSCGFYTGGMERLKRSFGNALEPVNFIIKCWIYGGEDYVIEPFELKNNWTGERLTFRRIGGLWLFARCPIGREEDKWAKWEKEAIELDWDHQWNYFSIDFKDRHIGDGMLEENEGPSDPKKPKK